MLGHRLSGCDAAAAGAGAIWHILLLLLLHGCGLK
jgi:hypothetical protein